MPYNNAYNQNIARQLNNLYKNKVKYENACCDNVRQNDVMDPLEGMALRRATCTAAAARRPPPCRTWATSR